MALDAPPEEVQAIVDMGDQGLFLRQAKAHRGQDPGYLFPQLNGVRLGAMHGQAPVVRVPDQPVVGQTVTPPLGRCDLADPGTPGTPDDVFVQDRQGHVAQQG